MKEITKEDGTKIDDFHKIQEEAKLHFERILTKDNTIDINIQENLLINILSVVN